MVLKKKGAVTDTVIVVAVVFIFAILILIGAKLNDEISSNILDNRLFESNSNTSKSMIGTLSTGYNELFDNIFFFGFIFLMIATIILAIMIDTHPAIFFVSIIIFIFVLVVSMIFGNAFVEIGGSSSLGEYASSFVKMSWLMNHLLQVMIVYGGVLFVALYGKMRSG